MTTQALLPDDVFSLANSKPAVEVQVDEVTAGSPAPEKKRGIVVETVELITSISDSLVETPAVVTDDQITNGRSSSKSSERLKGRERSKSPHQANGSTSPVRSSSSLGLFNQRRPSLQLSALGPFNSLIPQHRSSSSAVKRQNNQQADSDAQTLRRNDHCSRSSRRPTSHSWPQQHYPTSHPVRGDFGGAPLLTPPEDVDSFKWENLDDTSITTHAHSGQTGSRHDGPSAPLGTESDSSRSRPSEINIPHQESMAPDPQGPGAWLYRASNRLVSELRGGTNPQHIQMVVQAIPSLTKPNGEKAVFEQVIESIQAHAAEMPDITITHAMPQARTLDEVPTSPPATPNLNQHASEGYFENQTVFTHAAKIPIYHNPSVSPTPVSQGWNTLVAAPSSIHISTLERYIPPTSEQELRDFFSAGRRSYLADRLLELSVYSGTMMLIFPTKIGATRFADHYLGPIMEPYVRRFVLINNLFTDVAFSLAGMQVMPYMYSFEDMQRRIEMMCTELGQRSPVRGVRSRYDIVHAETEQVILERNMWIDAFLEQEKPRLRQNLVDYHKAGGRMPARDGHIEVTVNMLARELIEGIRGSKEPAGDVGIEVAVFVIRRSTA